MNFYVDTRDGHTGSEGPFFVAYVDEDGTDPYGYPCSNCETSTTRRID